METRHGRVSNILKRLSTKFSVAVKIPPNAVKSLLVAALSTVFKKCSEDAPRRYPIWSGFITHGNP